MLTESTVICGESASVVVDDVVVVELVVEELLTVVVEVEVLVAVEVDVEVVDAAVDVVWLVVLVDVDEAVVDELRVVDTSALEFDPELVDTVSIVRGRASTFGTVVSADVDAVDVDVLEDWL